MFVFDVLFYQAETLNSQLVTEGKKEKIQKRVTFTIYNFISES